MSRVGLYGRLIFWNDYGSCGQLVGGGGIAGGPKLGD